MKMKKKGLCYGVSPCYGVGPSCHHHVVTQPEHEGRSQEAQRALNWKWGLGDPYTSSVLRIKVGIKGRLVSLGIFTCIC